LRVIGFAEKGSSNSAKNLNSMNLEYNLYPAVSGPSIERMVLKILRDDELKKQNQSENRQQFSTENGGANSDAITLRGGGTGENGDAASSFEQARAALASMMSSDADEQDSNSGVIIQKGGDQLLHSTKQEGSESTSNGYQNWNEESKKQAGAYFPDQEEQSKSSSAAAPTSEALTKTGSSPEQNAKNKTSSPHSNETSPQGTASSLGTSSSKPGAGDEYSTSEKGSSNKSYDTDQKKELGKKDPRIEADRVAKKAKRIRYFSEQTAKAKDETIIVRGTQQALEDSVNLVGSNQPEEVEEASHLACITVQSPKFSGYLLSTMGKDTKIDASLIQMIRKRLFLFLREHGEDVKNQDSMDIKVQLVDFVDWSIDQAQFLRKSIHNNKEVVMAFFPHKELKTEFELSDDAKMIRLSVDDLKDDAPVEFDLYIYMPENQKYILYTPKDGVFYGDQKKRLKTKGVGHMHLKKEAVQTLAKYQAQNFLNDKINVYHSASQKTEAPQNSAPLSPAKKSDKQAS